MRRLYRKLKNNSVYLLCSTCTHSMYFSVLYKFIPVISLIVTCYIPYLARHWHINYRFWASRKFTSLKRLQHSSSYFFRQQTTCRLRGKWTSFNWGHVSGVKGSRLLTVDWLRKRHWIRAAESFWNLAACVVRWLICGTIPPEHVRFCQ